jgi:large subunit ribosomal protein L18
MANFNKKIYGTKDKPRISVFRSNRYISAQFIDDDKNITILGITSKEIADKVTPIEKARLLGLKLAEMAKAKKIKTAVYDRNGYLYHGQIKSLADGIREGGIEF